MRVRAVVAVVEMCKYAFVRRCFVMNMDVSMCARTRVKTQMGRGWCQGQGQSRETLFTGERWSGTCGSEGKRKRRKKQREIQGEVLLSLTTKMEVRQGQAVGDLPTEASSTCVVHTSRAPFRVTQDS